MKTDSEKLDEIYKMKSPWTADKIRFLIHLYNETEYSAARIALVMNLAFATTFTRNAILGQLYRLRSVGRVK